MIAEPTLEHYIYYLRHVEGDNATAVRKRRTAFEQELASLLAHLERLSGQAIPEWEWPEESQDRCISQRIVRTAWMDNPATGRSCFVEARTYDDVYWLQVGYCQEGSDDLYVFAGLRDEAWEAPVTDHLLGHSSYLCGIVPDLADERAARALGIYTNDHPNAILSTYLTQCCAGLYGSPARPTVTALLYPDEVCEDWAGRTILNDVAPRLELYRHKTDRQLAWCEGNYALLSEQERALRDILYEARHPSRDERELLAQLARLHPVFTGNVGTLADRGTTININLDNLDAVIKDLGPLAEDHLLSARRDDLRRRQKELAAVLDYANQPRQQTEGIITALTATLGLERLLDVEATPRDAASIEVTRWPGAPPSIEAEIQALTPHQKPAQSVTYPQINVPPHIPLTSQDQALLQRVYHGFDRVLIEKEFGGGYGGARVLLTLPITTSGVRTVHKITKLGSALELRRERANYTQFVEDFLPFSAARVERERYCEHDGQAALNYVFVGGGELGRTVDLEEYYHHAVASGTVEPVVRTLNALLDQALGQRWFGHSAPLYCFFAAEYGRHLVEHLRLRLRPASHDALWPHGQSPNKVPGYRQISIEAIPSEHEAIEPGRLLTIEGLIVTRVKHSEFKLQDPDGQGIVVRVEFAPENEAAQGPKIGDCVGVRGQVRYNRHARLEQIVCDAFPGLSTTVHHKSIALPDVPGTYPNPLQVYPEILSKVLEGRRSYVHGDLHLRNVLVDERGKGWLIDFARVEERHNLFDFIKLETYIRLMGLSSGEPGFSLNEYVQFEEVLSNATLGERVTLPSNPELLAAYRVVTAMRQIAQRYMGREPDFKNEYFPALFLYCLAVVKYYQKERPQPTRLVFATASVLSRYAFEGDDQARLPSQPLKGDSEPSGPEQPLGTGNRWAVLVGVDEYEDQANYGRLQVCVKDVGAIREQLIAGGFESIRIRLLTDHTSELPTRPNILTALKAVADATEPDDLLLFYYTGHGDEDGGESYLVARDGRRLVLGDTAVPVARIKEIMEKAPARGKVIVLDACHSGADIGGKGPKPMSAEFIRRVFEEAEGLAILASCKQGQLSYEWRAQGHSVFTHFFLEAFTGDADQDEKGFVTVQDASRHVTNGVKLWASQNNVSQTPTLQYTVTGDIVLVRY